MHYREFGKTGLKLSALGFGMMRLPILDGEAARIDEVKATEMIRYAIDNGVNYLDSAWSYHGGKSEEFMARVLTDGYRERVNIGTKLPTWEVKKKTDMNEFLEKQLMRLKTEQIDLYLLHTLCGRFWETMKEMDYASFLDKAKSDGKIRFAGFSFHDNFNVFKDIVDSYPWDFCFIQLNFLDLNYQAGLKGLKYAAEKGMGVMLMEPLRGGMLGRTELPAEVEALWNKAEQKRTPAEWALRSVWNYPETGVVLSGMNTMEQVVENIRTASEAMPKSLSFGELTLIKQVTEAYRKRIAIDCTSCGYCMPCPSGVNIPELFWALNHAALFDDEKRAESWVNGYLTEKERPSNCIECGACEELCPQNLPIIQTLKQIQKKYEKS